MSGTILSIVRNYEASEGRGIDSGSRPCFHLSPLIGWMNDPNGFSLYNGEYHLFYQYYPYDTSWGPMHWGHAKSRDLIRWEYLPCALAPDGDCDREGCWSGSAVTLPDGRHMIIYTGRMPVNRTDGEERIYQVQCAAYGDGIDYEKYDGNPILTASDLPEGSDPYDFRDPKVWWDEREDAYMLLVGSRAADGSGQLLLYRSAMGVDWEFLSVLDASRNEYGSMWECPDFFEIDGTAFILVSPQDMKLEGEFRNRHGNMVISGKYDPANHSFERNEVHPVDYGYDFYAAQTLRADDGRVIMIAWMQAWENSTMRRGVCLNEWTGMMTLPRELSVKDGRLIQTPVRELMEYRSLEVFRKEFLLDGEMAIPEISGRCLELNVKVSVPDGGRCGRFELRLAESETYRSVLACEMEAGILTFDRSRSGYENDALAARRLQLSRDMREISLRVILDRYSAEIFVNGGEQVFTAVLETPQEAQGISFYSDEEAICSVEKYDLLIP